jgi:hypothetical protein
MVSTRASARALISASSSTEPPPLRRQNALQYVTIPREGWRLSYKLMILNPSGKFEFSKATQENVAVMQLHDTTSHQTFCVPYSLNLPLRPWKDR